MSAEFLAFCHANNVLFDSQLVEIRSSGLSHSIHAVKALKEGDVLCSIPKEAILSVRTTAIADIIEQEEIGGIIGLSVAVMYEQSLGVASPFHAYIASLPSVQSIPYFWNQADVSELAGTDLANELVDLESDLQDDYRTIISPLLEKYPQLNPESMQFTHFMKVVSWCTSRAFDVDAYHNESLVPFADLFNHKTCGENVHFTSDADVCPFCGSLGGCDCVVDDEEWEDTESAKSVAFTNDSIPNLAVNANGDELELRQDILEMIIVKSCGPGDEIFSTYGKQSNTSLLNRYGFIEADNPYSCVAITRDQVLECLPESISAESVQDRLDFWEAVGMAIVEQIESRSANDEENDLFGDGEDVSDSNECIDSNLSHHEHDGQCCGSADQEMESENECEEDDAESEDNEFLEDSFSILASGPNFSLRVFLGLMFLGDNSFDDMSRDLERSIENMVQFHKTKWDSSSTRKEECTVISMFCSQRLKEYPTTLKQDEMISDAQDFFGLALSLRMEEKKILKSFIL